MKHKANKDESWGEEPGMAHHIDMKPLMKHDHNPMHHHFGHYGGRFQPTLDHLNVRLQHL